MSAFETWLEADQKKYGYYAIGIEIYMKRAYDAGANHQRCAAYLWNSGQPSPRTCDVCSLDGCPFGEVKRAT